jgi:hypothetical protein
MLLSEHVELMRRRVLQRVRQAVEPGRQTSIRRLATCPWPDTRSTPPVPSVATRREGAVGK